jgi:hypothetical protein
MNRLVIIGNGFDLAHGLPTSYKHFIDDFWKNFKEKHNSDEYNELVYVNDLYYQFYSNYGLINNFIDFKNSIKEYIKDYPSYDFNEHQLIFYSSKLAIREKIFEFRNDFFRRINLKRLENWVDIENEYYDRLKNCFKQGQSIVELNKEFNQVKSLLGKYLNEKVEKEYDFKNLNNHLFKIICNREYKNNELIEFLKEVSNKGIIMLKENHQNYLKKATGYGGPDKVPDLNISTTFISFNYTSTMNYYLNSLNIKSEFLNEIHGSISDKLNPINFGFGDEMDDDYKSIENINDNEYLRNIKSFQYLHTPNYKKLLDLIESEVFQVYIMGHSCGLSDRTLLNTIFEHENCYSIKIFYHEKEDGSDNYTEIIQNISRHFNKKKLMREKIVNKTLCQPLPQIKLPKKQ